jgi:hypothetical protein
MTTDVDCAPCGDCTKLNPAFTTFNIAPSLTSEDFCAGKTLGFAEFLPFSSVLLPTTGTKPFTIHAFTSLAHPYTFSAGTVNVPPGFTLVSFTEDLAKRACDDVNFPNGCRQWWNIVVDPGTACAAAGSYDMIWNVGCDASVPDGGGCNPAVTTYTGTAALTDRRNLCPP